MRATPQPPQRMVELAAQQPGYLGVESTRGGDGFGITVSYWESEAAIAAWRQHAEHAADARPTAAPHWYEHYELRVAKVERAYGKRDGASRSPPSSNRAMSDILNTILARKAEEIAAAQPRPPARARCARARCSSRRTRGFVEAHRSAKHRAGEAGGDRRGQEGEPVEGR